MSTSPIFKPSKADVLDSWLQSMKDFHAIAVAILRVIHPNLYDGAMAVASRLSADVTLHDHIKRWALPFTAVSLMSNRETIKHRDMKTGETMYDLLFSVGPYQYTELEISDRKSVV